MTIEPFKHHILVGHMADAEQWEISLTASRVFVTVVWDGEELHFTGVEGPKRNGDAHGSCGQIDMNWWENHERWTYGSPDMPRERVERLMELWDRWHLNHMKAGSPAQEAWLRANPVTAIYPESHFDKAREALAAAGLQPDPNYYGRDSLPYSYGSAWLHEEVPHDVLVELLTYPTHDGLPDCWQ